jgi:peroxiredoxin
MWTRGRVQLCLWVAVAVLACSAESADKSAAAGEAATGEAKERIPAPDFTLPDLHGNPVSLADFRGKTVVIDFWATWCPPCIFQVPELNAFWKAHRDAGDVAVLGVAVDVEGAEVVAPWVEEQHVEYTILIGDEQLAKQFGAMGFPTVVIVAPNGDIHSLHVGLLELDELEQVTARVTAAG